MNKRKLLVELLAAAVATPDVLIIEDFVVLFCRGIVISTGEEFV